MWTAEYMAVVAEAVGAVRRSMADHRLPELTPEQLAWWFRTIIFSNIERVVLANTTPKLRMVERRELQGVSFSEKRSSSL
jgi:hypothetical protein